MSGQHAVLFAMAAVALFVAAYAACDAEGLRKRPGFLGRHWPEAVGVLLGLCWFALSHAG
mgnify:CR=1 FL=1